MPAKIIVQNVFSRIFGAVPEDIEYLIKESLQYKVFDYQHILKSMDDNMVASSWDGAIPLYWPYEGHRFYTGMLSDVRKILDAYKFEYIIEDRRSNPNKNFQDLKFILPPGKTERAYQNIVIASLIKATRGVLQAATGSGKTFMITKLIGTIKCEPFLFFVLSKDLMDQAYECLSSCLTTPIGRIGDGHFNIQKINVVMLQTAIKAVKRNDPKFKVSDYRFDEEDDWDNDPIEEAKAVAIDNLIRSAKGVYLDECHHASSRTCQTIMEACSSAYYRYGGSATPFREDGAEKMIQALFGRIIQKISASWLIKNNYLVKPYIFNIKVVGMHGMWNSYQQVYKHYIVENYDLNQLVAQLANKMAQFNIPTLILVQQYPQGKSIQKLLNNAPFIKGNMPRKKRREAISSLRDGTIPCAIATTLADEGLDVERLGCVAVAGGGKSISRVYQRVGRAIRAFKGKEKAIVFLFHHDAPFLNAHGSRVIRILKEEPEFVIINSDENRIMNDINELLCPSGTGIFSD